MDNRTRLVLYGYENDVIEGLTDCDCEKIVWLNNNKNVPLASELSNFNDSDFETLGYLEDAIEYLPDDLNIDCSIVFDDVNEYKYLVEIKKNNC